MTTKCPCEFKSKNNTQAFVGELRSNWKMHIRKARSDPLDLEITKVSKLMAIVWVGRLGPNNLKLLFYITMWIDIYFTYL